MMAGAAAIATVLTLLIGVPPQVHGHISAVRTVGANTRRGAGKGADTLVPERARCHTALVSTTDGVADPDNPHPQVTARWARLEDRVIPAWLRPTPHESRKFVAVAILIAAALHLVLARQFTLIHPRWVLPALEIALLVTLMALSPLRRTRYTAQGRYVSLVLVAIISLDNGYSAFLLDVGLINGKVGNQAGPLLASAGAIYLTNIIAFGIWYWELDRGGPLARAAASRPYPDFLFPQMTQEHLASHHWEPRFGDYLYLSFTNATAFSPTDTMPMPRWAKGLMAVQSAIALSMTALVIARAVNILK